MHHNTIKINESIKKIDNPVQTHTWGHENNSSKTFCMMNPPLSGNIVHQEFMFKVILPKNNKNINKIFIDEFKKKE